MRVVFVGAVKEGWSSLEAILKHPEYSSYVKAIITLDVEKTDNISGFCSFDDLAAEYNVPIHKLKHIRTPEAVELIKELAPDLMMVIGWSQLLDDEVLSIPPLGCIGLHTTLLPKHRGRAPIPWAIIKGLGRSGNTLFYFTPGADNGDIIGQEAFYITLADTAETIYTKATNAGINLLLKYLPQIKNGTAPRIKQNEDDSDHWPKRRPKDGLIDWSLPAGQVHDLIRGVTHPYPGAFTYLNDKKVLVWQSNLLGEGELELDIKPGVILDSTVYDNAIIVGTGQGAIMINSFQIEGEEELGGYDFMEKYNLEAGIKFITPSEI